MDEFEHFQEIRFKIDQHREELKKRIDEIALAMIDETKKYENKYSRDLKEKSSEIEDTFRNPNLLITTVQEIQRNKTKL